MSVSEALATLVDETMESIGVGPAQRVSSGAAMPSVPERQRAQEGQRACWPTGPATPGSCAPLRRTTPNSTSRTRITIDSVRTHTTKHFPVQSVAKATYRDILERRARENHIDFIEGVATALTPMAFYEVVMTKAFRTLVDAAPRSVWRPACEPPRSFSPSSTGVRGAPTVLELKVQLGQILEAVKSTVPQELWGEIVEKIEELEQHPEALDVEADSFDDADDDLRPDRVHRRGGRRVLTSAAPAVTECDRVSYPAGLAERVWREQPAKSASAGCSLIHTNGSRESHDANDYVGNGVANRSTFGGGGRSRRVRHDRCTERRG